MVALASSNASDEVTDATGDPLRIVHVTDGSAWGGMEAYLLTLHRAAKRRSDLSLRFVFTRDAEPRRRFAAEGADAIALAGGRLAQLRRLRARLTRDRADVIHAHGYLGAVLGGVASLGLVPGRVVTLHGAIEPGDAPTDRIWWYARAAKWLQRRLGAEFVPVSEIIARDWERHGIPRERMTIIHNGIDLGDASSVSPTEAAAEAERRAAGPVSGDTFRIGIVGRLVPVKDHQLFLEVAARLCRARTDVRFEVIGDGPLRASLEAAARDLDIASRVEFLGHRDDVLARVSQLDLLLFTSESEGVSYALLEAMALGVPAVAPAVGGLPEVIADGESGRIVAERAADDIAAACAALLDDGAGRGRCSAGARDRVRAHFSGAAMLAATRAVYGRALTRADAGGRR